MRCAPLATKWCYNVGNSVRLTDRRSNNSPTLSTRFLPTTWYVNITTHGETENHITRRFQRVAERLRRYVLYFTLFSQFLPRDAMRKRGLCYGPVSVCLSVTFVYCMHTAEDIIKLLPGPGSSIILVFWLRVKIHNSKANPYDGGAKYTGVGKICDFRLKSPFICETVRDRPVIALVGSRSWRFDRCRFRWPWVTSKGGTRGSNYWGGFP